MKIAIRRTGRVAVVLALALFAGLAMVYLNSEAVHAHKPVKDAFVAHLQNYRMQQTPTTPSLTHIHTEPHRITSRTPHVSLSPEITTHASLTRTHSLNPSEWTKPSTGTTEDELAAVQQNLDKCLDASNLSTYFREKSYYATALINAKQTLWTLRQIIPQQFSITDPIPCWKMNWDVWGSTSSLRVWGEIGQFSFNHSSSFYQREILKMLQNDYNGHLSLKYACLPKVFLAGFPKCGSTFIYCLLNRIAQLEDGEVYSGVSQAVKEPRWWSPIKQKRQYLQLLFPHHLVPYLLTYAKGVKSLLDAKKALTIDGSQNLLFEWPRFSKSETFENYCLLPAILPLLLPSSKYIIITRDPIRTLYSAFWFSCTSYSKLKDPIEQQRGPDVFHSRVMHRLREFAVCRESLPLQLCVINPESPEELSGESGDWAECGRVKLEITMFHFHIRKLLSVVPHTQFLLVSNEEVVESVATVANKISEFLGFHASITNDSDALNMFPWCKNSQETVKYDTDPLLQMRDDTRKQLEQFYKPFYDHGDPSLAISPILYHH